MFPEKTHHNPYSLMVMILDFQSRGRGSIPRRDLYKDTNSKNVFLFINSK